MKTALRYATLISMLLGTGCSTNYMANTGGGSPQNPPFPKTNSVLPLAVNNQWIYSFTGYDSSGARISPNRLDLHLGITGGYGLKNDTQLVRLTWENQSDVYSDYAYQFVHHWGIPGFNDKTVSHGKTVACLPCRQR
jgi:hypothetical protein